MFFDYAIWIDTNFIGYHLNSCSWAYLQNMKVELLVFKKLGEGLRKNGDYYLSSIFEKKYRKMKWTSKGIDI